MNREPMRRPSDAGYTLVELLVSMGIMLVVTGAVFTLVDPSQSTSQTQPEVQDMQQRMRVAADSVYKDLQMAGAGPYLGDRSGSLAAYFAAILPRKTGLNNPDPVTSARSDAISLTYVPNTYSQTTISQSMPPNSTELKVQDVQNCPPLDQSQLCGFNIGDEVLIFDDTGHFDTFTITNVQDDAGHLQHRGQDFTHTYDSGASVLKVKTHTYYLDSTTHQLRDYDGGDVDLPVVDNVVGLTFEYFGDAAAPASPKPPFGTANCLYDTSGTLVASLQNLTTGDGSLAPLPLSMFTDGPWCNDGSTNQFDADLYRVRKVRVTIRVQTPLASLRGTDPQLFINPGTSIGGKKFIPDMITKFEVAPRNLNLTR